MSLLEKWFPSQSRNMVSVYQGWVQRELSRDVDEWRVRALMEADLIFGKHVFQEGITEYLEIGCGVALPSIAVMRQGGQNVRAFDISLGIVKFACRMSDAAGIKPGLICRDFNYSRFDPGERTIWYANKPRSMRGDDDFLWRILTRGIRKQVPLALVPRYGETDTDESYHCLCQRVVSRLRRGGYEAEWGKLHPEMPLMWILALPGGRPGVRDRAVRGQHPERPW